MHIDWAYTSDEHELLKLFETAFGHPISLDLWRWKYHNVTVLGSLVRQENTILAFYGGIPRSVMLFGSEIVAIQVVDVMVHPSKRGLLKRKGLFFEIAKKYIENYIGYHKNYSLAFGFPSFRHFQLGTKHNLYSEVGRLMEITWPALEAKPSISFKIRPLTLKKSEIVDRLWASMAESLVDQIVGVRDWNYVHYRYLQHPTINYQLYLVTSRISDTPIGIFVLNTHDQKIELIDIIAKKMHIGTVVHAIRRIAWNLGKPFIYGWITANNSALLAGKHGTVNPTEIIVPITRWTPGISADEVVNRWWLMAGDTDFR